MTILEKLQEDWQKYWRKKSENTHEQLVSLRERQAELREKVKENQEWKQERKQAKIGRKIQRGK